MFLLLLHYFSLLHCVTSHYFTITSFSLLRHITSSLLPLLHFFITSDCNYYSLLPLLLLLPSLTWRCLSFRIFRKFWSIKWQSKQNKLTSKPDKLLEWADFYLLPPFLPLAPVPSCSDRQNMSGKSINNVKIACASWNDCGTDLVALSIHCRSLLETFVIRVW